MRLSQYIGDFQPDAHVNGFLGCNFTALILSNFCATFFSNTFIMNCFECRIKYYLSVSYKGFSKYKSKQTYLNLK